jgi:hypothetical protein
MNYWLLVLCSLSRTFRYGVFTKAPHVLDSLIGGCFRLHPILGFNSIYGKVFVTSKTFNPRYG